MRVKATLQQEAELDRGKKGQFTVQPWTYDSLAQYMMLSKASIMEAINIMDINGEVALAATKPATFKYIDNPDDVIVRGPIMLLPLEVTAHDKVIDPEIMAAINEVLKTFKWREGSGRETLGDNNYGNVISVIQEEMHKSLAGVGSDKKTIKQLYTMLANLTELIRIHYLTNDFTKNETIRVDSALRRLSK